MTWKNETTRQPLPAPLPMYEPVRLKHVPTIVRRRYDRDLKTFKNPNEGFASEDGSKSNVDGVEDDDLTAITTISDVDDSVDNNEVEDEPEDATLIDYVNPSVKIEVQDNEQVEYIGFQEQDNKIDEDATKNETVTSWYENGSLQDGVQDDEHENFDNKQGLPEEDDKSEGDEAGEDVIHDAAAVPDLDDSVDYEAEDDAQAKNFDTKHDPNADTSVNNGAQHNEQGVCVGFHEQDNNINDYETKDDIAASWYENGSAQEKVNDDEHENFDKGHGFPEEDDKSEGNKAEDVIHDAAGPDLDDSIDYEAEDDDAAGPVFDDSIDYEAEDNDGTMTYTTESFDTNNLEETKFEVEIQDRDGASSMEGSVEDSIKDHGHENSDLKDQDSCSKDLEDEDGANKDVNIASVDTSVNNGDNLEQHNERDLLVSDYKRIEDGTVANNFVDESFKLEEIIENQHEDLDIEQDFPEAFMKTLERDGYELCCPNCKHIITRTMIFRRRVDCPESRTTCFSFLTSLFCCSRW